VTTGAIVASESLSGNAKDSVCKDSYTPLQGKQEMLAIAKRSALEKFRELVAPYYVNVEIKLLTKDDSKISSDAKKNIDSGIKWSKNGRFDRACEDWHAAHNIHPRGYAIPYLLGVCAEISGNLEKALSYYEKADRSTGKPVKEINAAIGRVNVSISKKKKLVEQMKR
jgi:tetratricopeptide (TPR) repeat protein